MMRAYENSAFEGVKKAEIELTAALDKENKLVSFIMKVLFVQSLATIFALILAVSSDRSAFRTILPMSILSIIVMSDLIFLKTKWSSWNDYLQKRKAHLEKTKILSEYNTQKVLEIMGEAELIAMATNDSFEFRTIN